jgi:hypothetical protein
MQESKDVQTVKAVKSSALQRRVQCYPPTGLYNQVARYAKEHGMSSSQAAVYMMRCFFNNQPSQVKSGYAAAGSEKINSRPS